MEKVIDETEAEIDDEPIQTNLSYTVAANINLKPNDSNNESKCFVEETTRTNRRNPRFLISNYKQREIQQTSE